MNVRRSNNGSRLGPMTSAPESATERIVLDEQAFRRMISIERKRSERSRKPFLLMLLDMGESRSLEKSGKALDIVLGALSRSTRETDVTGWYEDRNIVGVMFTEIGTEDRDCTLTTLISRFGEMLRTHLSSDQFNRISLSFHVFPEEQDQSEMKRPSQSTLYPDLTEREDARKSLRVIKRVMDVVGSIAALVFLSPIFLLIAAVIKATSKGPVFFRQDRIGERGEPFEFLKFRSMYMNNDAGIHKEYVKKLIAGQAALQPSEGASAGVYKLTKDPRITRVGAFLRRTSLDELPQFINVLQGKMSLVGPRPPVPYEVEAYDLWHRRRLLEAKPGITGLWQINGRSRVKFDDMVRLDLQYAKSWSPWMDIKILLRTPAVVIFGDGAH